MQNSNDLPNNYEELKQVWLEDNGYSECDVMVDDDEYSNRYAEEYVISIEENGTAGEAGYNVKERRIYLSDVIRN